MMGETAEQKKIRIFNLYKKDLEKLGKEHGQIRMICVEYISKMQLLALKQHGFKGGAI